MILTTPEIICLAVTAAIGVCGILEDNGLMRLPVPFMKRIPARPLRRSGTSLHARRIHRQCPARNQLINKFSAQQLAGSK